jgi:hypothetical protein
MPPVPVAVNAPVDEAAERGFYGGGLIPLRA